MKIIADNVTKSYRMGQVTVEALRGVSLAIKEGEFVGIMGASGSGKSTLLHLLGLLNRPTSGRIVIDGTDIGALSEGGRTKYRLSRLGYVFQDYALVPELTLYENVTLTSKARYTDEKQYREHADLLLAEVRLADRTEHLPAELSGGQQQRAAIARAVLNGPEILFADEPCANLDSESSRTVLDLFARINEERNQTIVMVSHEDWHREYFDRTIELKDGQIVPDARQN